MAVGRGGKERKKVGKMKGVRDMIITARAIGVFRDRPPRLPLRLRVSA
jgi:hypothetical protein